MITTSELKERIAIIGFKNVKIKNIKNFIEVFKNKTKIPIQFFNAKNVAGLDHLYFAALNTLIAFEKGTNISNHLAVELLIYASAQRQITKAIKMIGITQDSSEIAVLIIAKNRNEKENCIKLVIDMIPGEQDDTVIKLTTKKVDRIKRLYTISDLEIEAKLKKPGLENETLTDLIIERMALLVLKS
jgi:KEOPS complex subunit Cgi121